MNTLNTDSIGCTQQLVNEHGKFMLNGRHFFLTYPQHLGNKEELLVFLKDKMSHYVILYIVVCQEQHEDGSPHLHAYFNTQNKVCFRKPDCFDFQLKHGDYAIARNPKASIDYVKKDGNFIEEGLFKCKEDKQREVMLDKQDLRKEKNTLILNNPLHNLVDDGVISISQVPLLEKAKAQYTLGKKKPDKFVERTCIWIYGKPGIGKSKWVRDHEDAIYEKSAKNKWWDGYQHEDIVLMDDFDIKGEHLSHDIKVWSDGYRFIAETKGGQMFPTYTKLYVTSNYLPEELFDEDTLCHAIRRRFQFKTIDSEYNLVDYFYDHSSIGLLETKRDQKYKETHTKRERSRDRVQEEETQNRKIARLETELNQLKKKLTGESLQTELKDIKYEMYKIKDENERLRNLLKTHNLDNLI